MPRPPTHRATFADLAALPDDVSAEIVGGRVVPLPTPSFAHGDVVATLGELLVPYRSRRGGGLGGWWMATSVDVALDPHEVYCPDLVGWRWDRVPERPKTSPHVPRPDWVCEVQSPGTSRRDRVDKLLTCHRVGVPHYWLVDPADRVLVVHRWAPEGYLVALVAAERGQVRPEPFDALPMCLEDLFGAEPVGLHATSVS